jgi:multicomponent Na+:H+ antiporter subunit G
VLGVLFVAAGVYSVLRYREFYSRVVITAKVDTVGFMTIMIGLIVMEGISAVSLKILLVLLFELMTSPLATHAIAHSAFSAGYRIEREEHDDGN